MRWKELSKDQSWEGDGEARGWDWGSSQTGKV